MTRLGLSPVPALAVGLVVLVGGIVQLVLASAWLNGSVEVAGGVGLMSLSLLRSAILRAGIKLGQELGQIEGHHLAREEMYCSLREAQARGMTPSQWLDMELERDRGNENRR